MPPFPPQVRMWELAKLVTLIVESFAGRAAAQQRSERVAGILDRRQPMAVAMERIASQSGALPIRFGTAGLPCAG